MVPTLDEANDPPRPAADPAQGARQAPDGAGEGGPAADVTRDRPWAALLAVSLAVSVAFAAVDSQRAIVAVVVRKTGCGRISAGAQPSRATWSTWTAAGEAAGLDPSAGN